MTSLALAWTADRTHVQPEQTVPQLENDTLRDLALGHTIGMGGMGLVRDGVQRAMGRHVAVKTLRPDRDDSSFALVLLREAWITGALEHPNIIPIYSIGADEHGSPMIVMKRVEGTPWSAFVQERAHDLRWHLRILIQVSNAIDFAGSRGIIHRDLKPDNVMIGTFGEVYVLDWGIAVSLGDDHGGRVPLAIDVRGISGTPAYMAPEMALDNGEHLSIRTDVYLLGAILHELITGKKRHSGPDVRAMMASALRSDPFVYDARVPRELADIANRAMHRDPQQRFATAGELRSAIERFLEHESSRELVEQAEWRMRTWIGLTELDSAPDPITIQSLFGEARFAFQQALREWPANDRAARGLERCLERKFDHDLERDDFESAAVVLAELGAGRVDLEVRLDELHARLAKRKRELTELRLLKESLNLDTGRATRSLLLSIGAVVHGLTPPLAALLGFTGYDGYPFFYAATVAKLMIGVLIAVIARRTLLETAVNRQLTVIVFMLITAELFIRYSTQNLGRSMENSLLVDFGIYALVTATVAITVDRRLLWAPVLYTIGSLTADRSLPNVYWLLGACHLACGIVTAGIWSSLKTKSQLGHRPPGLPVAWREAR